MSSIANIKLSKNRVLSAGGEKFFKNPVDNEPPPYDYMPVRPAHHAPGVFQGAGLRGMIDWPA